MKNRLTRILGVALTVALLVGLFVTAAPLSAGTNAWSKYGIPSTTGMVLDSGNVTGPMVMGSDGTVWAGRGTGINTGLIKSTDFGATWAMVTTFPAVTAPIMDIVVSSIDPLQVYVTDGSNIYKTADGGATWVTLSGLFSSLGVTPSPSADAFTMTATGVGADAFTMTATSGGGGAADSFTLTSTGTGADSFTMTATAPGTVTVATSVSTVSLAVTTEVGATTTTIVGGVVTFGDIGDIVTVTCDPGAGGAVGTITPGTGTSTDTVANDSDGDATVVSQTSFILPDWNGVIYLQATIGAASYAVTTEVGSTATTIVDTGGGLMAIVPGDVGDVVTATAIASATTVWITPTGGTGSYAIANDGDGDAAVTFPTVSLPDAASLVTFTVTSGSVSYAITEVGAVATTVTPLGGGVYDVAFGDVADIVTVTATAPGTAGTITPNGGASTDALFNDADSDAAVVSQVSFSLPDDVASVTVAVTSGSVGVAVTTEVGSTATTVVGGVVTFGDIGDVVTVTATAAGAAGTITPTGGTSVDVLSVDLDGDAVVVSQVSFSLPDVLSVIFITSLDVGYIGADAFIFAGTSTFGAGGGGIYVAQEAVFGMPWSDLLLDTDRGTPWGSGTDVLEVIVDPNTFGTTQMIMAVATDYDGPTTVVTTKYSGAQWGANVADVTLPGVVSALYSTSTWLPSDFSSSLASGTMQCFIGVDSMTAAEGDVFWVIFGTPGTAFDLGVNGVTGMGVTSLDGIGPGNSASMLASGYSAGAVTAPVVLSSSAGGAIWTANVKAPTGGATTLGTGTALSAVLIDPVSGNAIVATHGTDSALSMSTDWSVWNGVSLINAAIDAISDISVLGSTVCMVTNQTAGNIDSLWKNSGGTWMRLLSSATFGNSFDMHEYADGAHFLTDIGGTAIYRSLTGGATWATLVSAVPGAITAWQVVDANTIMVGGAANTIFQTTNGGVIWFTRTATGLGVPVAFAADAASGDILAASATNVAVSSDNGATWTTNTTATTNIAAAAFGSAGDYFITGTAGTFWSTGGAWTQIDDGASTMTVTAGSGIVVGPGVADVVYAADSGVAAGAARIRTDEANAEPLAGPAATTFMGLWFSDGSNMLWTIDTAGVAVYTFTDTLNVAASGVTTTVTSPTTATVTWDAMADATGYLVVVNPTAQTKFLTAVNGGGAAVAVTGTTAAITGMAAVTTYNVTVWGTAIGGAISSFSDAGSFTTNPTAPVAPVGLVPAPGAFGIPILPSFQWAPVPGALSYELELSDEPVFATIQATTTNPFYAWGEGGEAALEYGTPYYWRVRAVTGTGTSTWVSSVFNTMNEAIAPVDVSDTPDVILNYPAKKQITPGALWAVIAVGFVLTVAVIILIVRTRRVV